MKRFVALQFAGWALWVACCSPSVAERINQEGRILGPLPIVTDATLFNSSNADAIVSAMQIFPVTNPWNEDISRRPLLPNSDAMIAQIASDLSSNHRTLVAEYEMNFVLVPDNQPRVLIDFFNYPDESDLDGGASPVGLYPIPPNLPIESWPSQTGAETLQQWQSNNDGSDRHAIMVAPGAGSLWETWETTLVASNWEASNGAKFNLNNNTPRPPGWTSGDAAGFPMFPALVRFDEAERGMVEHACRLVVKRTKYGSYIYPATHYAASSANTNVNLPSMGQRLRLKAGFAIPSGWTREEKAVLLALKKYGAMVADNGSVFSISVTPDNRWPSSCFNHLMTIGITNFEVIQSTGPNEGPRSPGAPTVNAGVDRTVAPAVPVTLEGAVSWSNIAPTIHWSQYSGPGIAAFSDGSASNSAATFSAPGVYTLELSAADGVHAVAYDAVVFNVTGGIALSIAVAGNNVNLNWTGGTAPFVVQEASALPAGGWSCVTTTLVRSVSLPLTNIVEFFRIRSQ